MQCFIGNIATAAERHLRTSSTRNSLVTAAVWQTITLEMGAPLEDIIIVMTEEKAKHSYWLQIAVR